MPEVVIAHAAADDRDAFVAQRRQRLADRDVQGGIQVLAQRQHYDGNFGFRIDDQERHEDAMVEPALRIFLDREPRRGDQLFHAPPEFGRARRRIFELISVRREAIIVVDHARRGGGADRRRIRFPMRGDDDEGFWPLGQARYQPFEIFSQMIPGIAPERRRAVHPETGTAAVRQEDRRLAG